MRHKPIGLAAVVFVAVAFVSSTAHAIRVKVKQQKSDVNRVVVATTSGNLGVLENARGTANVSGNVAQLAVVKDNASLPVILAYKKGKRVITAKKALRKCPSGEVQAYTTIKGKRTPTLQLRTRSEGDVAFYNGRIKTALRSGVKKRSLGGLVDVDENCLPTGTGLTLGIGTGEGVSSLATAPETDKDRDGLLDLVDADEDNDGILNNYDPSNIETLLPKFDVFTNIKVSWEATVNSKAFGRSPTKAEVDTLTSNTTLAVEVKATGTDVSELDCGSLSYCSAGGTGATGNMFMDAFPGTAGGTYDADSDGNGTIENGGTGDFQLLTNLSAFNELNGGDALIQTVTPSGGGLGSIFLASLQFAFRSTPAIQTLVFDPDGTPATTTPSYPISDGDAGTPSNCISVAPNTDGNVIAEITAWRPERAGVPGLGEADFVDLGNSLVLIDIPNAPAPNGSMPTNGPGNCPASSYSESDSNLAASGDALQDAFGDTDADAANTLTFRVNITDCLSSVSQSLDSGDELKVDLQFRNNVGDNAAQAFCIQRP